MDNGRCNFLIISPKNGLEDWLEEAGGKTSYVGKHSYQPIELDYKAVAKEAFDFTGTFVPLYLLSDRHWQLVTGDGLTTEAGDIESLDNPELKKICKKQ